MKTKINILSDLSKLINRLSDLELVLVILSIAMGFMYIAWELGRAYARM
ncbi:hypothetical protein [Aquimarina sp. I32.4]|nr:hypothetical protein [Aquimarina sp. I32.4]